MSYLLKHDLAQAIINYLGSQPYSQVAGMVQGMQQLNEVADEDFGAFMAEQKAKVLAERPAQKGDSGEVTNKDGSADA